MIANIEHVAANALASPVVTYYQGWRLRYAYGVTRRANSVLAEHHQGNLRDKLQYVEDFYQKYGAVSRFQLCPVSQPADLETQLIARGYSKVSGALVQTQKPGHIAKPSQNITVKLNPKANAPWFQVYRTVEKASLQKESVRTWMLEHIRAKAVFAIAYLEAQAAAVGLGVLEHGYLGIFNMATLEPFRGQGCASAILSALSNWAKTYGAHTAYLQVASENHLAQRLYQNLGFTTLYAYNYLEKTS